MPPRTIDNLGVEVSTRYAEDKQILDETLVREARAIPVQIEIEVTAPFFPGEVDHLLKTQLTNITWASFSAPEHYFEQRKRLFTHQLIPSMGSEDKKESQAMKILNKLRSRVKERSPQTKEPKDNQQDYEEEEKGRKRQQYEEDRLLEEEEKEKKILTQLLNTIALFDKLIIEINSKRSQYQKG